jgi:hypothetical protein
MSGIKSLRILMLVSICATMFAREEGNGPLDAGRWGLLIGAGAAPATFKNRGFIRGVDPSLTLLCPAPLGQNVTTLTCDNIYKVLTNPSNALIEDGCRLPNFGKQFSNGVVHVTGQISYNVCSNTQYFIEAVYNRARGQCVNHQLSTFKAPDTCAVDCNSICSDSSSCNSSSSCSTSCSTSCSFLGAPFYTLNTTFSLSNYQAYGGYMGARYYWNRVWCDRVSCFTGFKVGMLHRKEVCVGVSVPQVTLPLSNGTSTTNYVIAPFASSAVPYCKSNAVSGGLQVGLDICINDCWSVLLGAEFVVTSPFKTTRNISIPAPDPVSPGQITPGFGRNFPHIYNVVDVPLGCLLQFPVWAGIRWEFDWCKDSCNEC